MVREGVGGAGRYVRDSTEGRGRGGLMSGLEDYVLFDCPGQVELFTHHSSLRNIFFRIQKLGYKVRCAPGLVKQKQTLTWSYSW